MKKYIHILFLFLFFFSCGSCIEIFAQKTPDPAACNCLLTTTVTANVTCNGGSNGAITANGRSIGIDCTEPGFGTGTYFWYPDGETTISISGKPAGTYTVQWDNSDCSNTATVAITQPSAITGTPQSTNETCNQNNGTVDIINVSGGAGSYSYSWNTGHTTSGVGNRNSGSYTCTVTDASNCTKTFVCVVGNTGTPVTANAAVVSNVLCFGGNSGSANVTVSGGGGNPYTYSWSPSGGNSSAANNLIAGGYTVTVTGSNGCVNTDNVTISQPSSAVTIGSTFMSPVSCFGGNNGSASVSTISGGTGGYTYTWAPSGGNAATANSLTAGTYNCTVRDANSCSDLENITVTQFPVLNGSISSTQPVTCFGGNNGSATATATGGNGAFTYAWSPSGGNAATANGLIQGNYNVTITDANGCTDVVPVTINQPSVLTANASSTAANCGTATGTASANAGGGTGAYTYSWSPSGGNGATAGSLFAGNYTVTVWDNNGCSVTDPVTVNSTGNLTANASTVTNVSCFGGSNGSANVTVSTGTPPYTYAWSPSGGTSSAASGLNAGVHSVTVTDNAGCVTTRTVSITQPAVLTASVSTNPAACGNNIGTATANPGGGTPGYIYSWAPSGGTNAVASNLAAGNYTVTVTDTKGCTKTASGNVASTPPISATISSTTTISCNGGNNGAATATVTVGTSPYTYNWSPSGGNAQTATGLAAGNYTVTITDNAGCTKTASVAITQPAALTTSVSVTPTACAVNNGTASASAGGGVGTYTYTWNTAPVQSSSTATGLGTGNYTVTVRDANNCSKTATVAITYSTSVSANISSSTTVTCNGGNNGAATATVTAGSSPFTYLWNTSPAQSAQTATGLSAGNYSVTITDNLSCVRTITVGITQPAAITASVSSTQTPCGMSTGSATANASGGTGALTYSWSTSPVQTTSTATGIPAGNYTATVTDANNCTKTFIALVTNTNGPVINVQQPVGDVSCFGGNDGTATVNVSGGFPPYSYLWNPVGGTTSSATGLSAGNYLITVTDASVCISSQTLTVNQPTPVLPNVTNGSISVCKGSLAPLGTNASGGSGGYSYNWVPAGDLDDGTLANPVAGPTVTTSYTVTVTDSKGCSGTGTATVTVSNLPNIIAGTDATICLNASTTLNASGGISYSWSPSAGLNNTTIANPVASPTANTSYIVIGTDSNGCSRSDSVNIQLAPTPTVIISSFNSTVCSGTSASLNATSNGTSYLWSTGQTTSSVAVIPTSTTTYSVTVSNGSCSAVASFTVTALPTPAAAITGNSVHCLGSTQVLTATAGNYSYSWSTGATSSSISISPTANTTYSVTVSSGSCASTSSLSVTVASLPVITTSATYPTICIGSSTDTLTATGGVSYSWLPGGELTSSIVVSPDIPTTYTVIVTNASGCSGMSTIAINVTNGFAIPNVTPGSLSGCLGDSLPVLTGTPNPSSNTIVWTDPGNSFSSSGNTYQPPSNLPVGSYTIYCIQGTGTSCQSNPAVILLIINPLPTAVAGSDVTICPGYTATISASGGTAYLWVPSNLVNNSAVASPAATVNSTTSFEVWAIDANGCMDRDSLTVYAELTDKCIIDIYNLISPNGDGDNDVWWIEGIASYPENTVHIFSRWGASVWEGIEYDNDEVVWRGQDRNGDNLPAGTYYYILETPGKQYSGFVQLMR